MMPIFYIEVVVQQEYRVKYNHDDDNIPIIMTCDRPFFIDYRSYSDLVSESISIILVLLLIFKVRKNILLLRTLLQSSLGLQHHNCLNKIRINYLALVCLLLLFLQIALSILIFICLRASSVPITPHDHDNRDRKIAQIYKTAQTVCINLLHCLIVGVGMLYWHTISKYLRQRDQQTINSSPKTLSGYFQRRVKWVFVTVFAFNLTAVIASVVLVTVADKLRQTHQQSMFTSKVRIVNIINLVGTVLSISVFLIARYKYMRFIRDSPMITASAYCKELLSTLTITLCCLIRIALYIIAMTSPQWYDIGRDFQPQKKCLDISIWHGFVLFSITIFGNLLPILIFSHTFTSDLHTTPNTPLQLDDDDTSFII